MKTSVLRLVVSLAGALLASAPLSARIVNLSTRGTIGSDDRRLITGFVIAGHAPKNVLVRGVGPGLTAFGVTDAAATIKVQLFDTTGNVVAENDGFQAAPDIAALEQLSAQVGAFALTDAGDSAVLATLPAGAYTVVATPGGDSSALGNALIEVYDLDGADAGSAIVNLSGRGMVGSGGNVLITGFVIAGPADRSLLIRGVGRDLAHYGIANPAAAVGVSLCDGSGAIIASGQSFAPPVDDSTMSTAMGAFPMNDEGGSTALLTLAPGAYTILVDSSPANHDDDIGLLEVYDGGEVELPEVPAQGDI